jgi:hypothetical protein
MDERAGELADQDRQGRALAALLDRVRPIRAQAHGGRGTRQAGGAR